MYLIKIKAPKIVKAVNSTDFPILKMYLNSWLRNMENDVIICHTAMDNGKPCVDIQLALFDYFFNEPESKTFRSLFEARELLYTIEKVINI